MKFDELVTSVMLSVKDYYLESALTQKTGHIGFGGRVFVYYNINLSRKLNKPLFSLKDLKTNKVIGHTESIMLKDCVFKVSESGRQRVIAQDRKNVHAGIVGTISDEEIKELPIKVTYNPKVYNTFVNKDDGTPITKAKSVSINNRRVTADGVE